MCEALEGLRSKHRIDRRDPPNDPQNKSKAGAMEPTLMPAFSRRYFRFHWKPRSALQLPPPYNNGNVIRGGFGTRGPTGQRTGVSNA